MSWEQLLSEEDYRLYRENIELLVEQLLLGFSHASGAPAIVEAIRQVPRHLFVDSSYRHLAYTDRALPTQSELTTSAPSVIAEMIFLAGVRRGDRVLEVGTGTGYEAAVLSEMGARVHSIELHEELAEQSNRVLVSLGYKHDKTADGQRGAESLRHYHEVRRAFPHRGVVDLYAGNGLGGLPDFAPFKVVIVSAAAASLRLVARLIIQLSPDGGRLVVPIGDRHGQHLQLVEKSGRHVATKTVDAPQVLFLSLEGV